MFKFIKKFFDLGPKVNYKELLIRGAQIVDVRTALEYEIGHIKGSSNIPLQELPTNLNKIIKNKPIITCCASGSRSGIAKSILLNSGFTEVYNGGGWRSLNRKILF